MSTVPVAATPGAKQAAPRLTIFRSFWMLSSIVFSTFIAVLREIFDEAAYARFLSRKQLLASRDSYAAFLNESAHAKARRPRCC